MKSIILAIILTILTSSAAEAGVLGKVGHFAKRAITLPLYIIGGSMVGGVAGTVAWSLEGAFKSSMGAIRHAEEKK